MTKPLNSRIVAIEFKLSGPRRSHRIGIVDTGRDVRLLASCRSSWMDGCIRTTIDSPPRPLAKPTDLGNMRDRVKVIG